MAVRYVVLYDGGWLTHASRSEVTMAANLKCNSRIYELGDEVKEPDTIIFQPGSLDTLISDMRSAGFEAFRHGNSLTWKPPKVAL